MGRPYTGADYTTNAYQLDAGQLRRSGVIVPGSTVRATMSWPDGPTLEVESTWTETERSLFLKFRLEEDREKPIEWTQRIYLKASPSNLGRGEVLFFYCPRTGKTCRKIYRAYHSRGFFHREAFHRPLYYPVQASSMFKKVDRQYAAAERKLESLRTKRRSTTYRGRATRRAERREKAIAEVCRLEDLRWSLDYFPKRLREFFTSDILKDLG